MSDSISYVLVTPYTIAKSRTGGVISRLLSRTDLELVGAQMIAPDEEFVQAYAENLRRQNYPNDITLLADYVVGHMGPSGGRRHRSLLLLFRGQDPCDKLVEICGHIYHTTQDVDLVQGETIRDTYADLITSLEDPEKVTYFEPAVLTPRNQKDANDDFRIFSRFLKGQGNLIQNVQYEDPARIEQTLVMIKPENWSIPSAKPGQIIDMFSRTGLRIIGVKVHHFSLEAALDFYGPVEGALKGKLSPIYGKKAREILEKELGIPLNDAIEAELTRTVGAEYARDQFNQIVKFMSGVDRDSCPAADRAKPGPAMTLILFYEGDGAIKKIRDVLGPTDPLKAPSGTVRREFGSNVMVNTAHASDSVESVEREKRIVKIEENSLEQIINDHLLNSFSTPGAQ